MKSLWRKIRNLKQREEHNIWKTRSILSGLIYGPLLLFLNIERTTTSRPMRFRMVNFILVAHTVSVKIMFLDRWFPLGCIVCRKKKVDDLILAQVFCIAYNGCEAAGMPIMWPWISIIFRKGGVANRRPSSGESDRRLKDSKPRPSTWSPPVSVSRRKF